jgi:hypothetical protein
MNQESERRFPRKRVVPIGLATGLDPSSLPESLVKWMAASPQWAGRLELFRVGDHLYGRLTGPGDGLSLLEPWEVFAGIPCDLPLVSDAGEYLFKLNRFSVGPTRSGDAGVNFVNADSPEDGRRYVLDVG